MSARTYFGKDLEAMTFAKNYHKWIVDEFFYYLGENVAEVGAGIGNFSDFLLDAGIRKLVAFEPSINMFDVYEKKYSQNKNVTAVNSFFEEQSENYINTFDSVCYVNVLEHIENDKEALRHAHKTLRKDGHILIFVPALSFLYSNLDKKVGHFRRYSKNSLIEVVNSAKFSIKEVRYFDIAGIIPWYIFFVLLKKTTTEGNVSAYDRFVVPVMRKIEGIIPPFIGKNLLLVGKKL